MRECDGAQEEGEWARALHKWRYTYFRKERRGAEPRPVVGAFQRDVEVTFQGRLRHSGCQSAIHWGQTWRGRRAHAGFAAHISSSSPWIANRMHLFKDEQAHARFVILKRPVSCGRQHQDHGGLKRHEKRWLGRGRPGTVKAGAPDAEACLLMKIMSVGLHLVTEANCSSI